LTTKLYSDCHGSTSESIYFEVDNLDTKTIEQAENSYEEVFITIRKVLEDNEQFCCDDENDRLSLTQSIADILRQSMLIRKEKR
tara:strand:+ start:5450 stop:5701 length:252 start_codon:yes stop_codon:yes gene_type:complete